MQGFLDGLVRSTKTVMTRIEFGGTLFLVAVIGVLLTSEKKGTNPRRRHADRSTLVRPTPAHARHTRRADQTRAYAPECVEDKFSDVRIQRYG